MRLEAPFRVPFLFVLLFDFIAMVCSHFVADLSIILLYFFDPQHGEDDGGDGGVDASQGSQHWTIYKKTTHNSIERQMAQ